MNQESTNRLLLLDDEPNVLRSLVRLLSTDGYDIHSFERPFDAIEMVKCSEVGVILIDQCMPQMEGMEFIQQLADIRPEIITILLTGYDKPKVQKGVRCADFCLTKPWDDQILKDTVAQAFQQYSKQAP